MPQLDKVIIFSQVFWLLAIFFSSFFLMSFYYLPKFTNILKLRLNYSKSHLENDSSSKYLNFSNKYYQTILNLLRVNYLVQFTELKKSFTNVNTSVNKLFYSMFFNKYNILSFKTKNIHLLKYN